VVLNAFQNVADALRALDADSQQWQLNSKAQQASLKALEVARKQRAAGAIPLQTVCRHNWQSSKPVWLLLQARLSRYADTVALYAAMGVSVPDLSASAVTRRTAIRSCIAVFTR
jgi:outer membrane protein TolC